MGMPALDFSVKSRGLGELKFVAIYIVDAYLGTPSVSVVSSCVFYLQQATTSNHPSAYPGREMINSSCSRVSEVFRRTSFYFSSSFLG